MYHQTSFNRVVGLEVQGC